MDYIKTKADLEKENFELNVIKQNVIEENEVAKNLTTKFNELSLLKETCNFARNNNIPVILDNSAKLLMHVMDSVQPLKILEIGTAIGYSGTIMLDIAKNSHLTTIEKNEKSYNEAIKNFKNNGLENRVNCILGDAKNEIENLLNKNCKFDFIFLDGPKGQYVKYFNTLNKLLNCNGIILADNVLFKGMVLGNLFVPHRKRTIVINLRKYLYNLLTNKNYENYLINIGDGVIISKKLKD